MKKEAEMIVETIKKVIADHDVQPGYPDANGNTNVTWCNRGAHRIAVALGGDMRPFLEPRGINWTNANAMFRHAESNGNEVVAEEAQELANEGVLVLAACFNPKGPGHVAVVCPSEEEYDDSIGPLVGETGWRCRIAHSKAAFEKFGFKARFFVIPKREGA